MVSYVEPRWLTDEEQRAWRAYLRGVRLLETELDRDLTDLGVQLSEYEILSMLSESPDGRLRMSVVADRAVQSRSRVTHTAARLERRGWVERRICVEDRRGVLLALTPQGREAINNLARVHVESVRRHLLDHLTHEQFMALGDAMAAVRDGIEAVGEPEAPTRTERRVVDVV